MLVTHTPCEFGNCVCGHKDFDGCVHSRFRNLEMRECRECDERMADWPEFGGLSPVRTWHTGGSCIRCMRRIGLVK